MLSFEEARDYSTVKRAIRACAPNLSVFKIEPNHGQYNYTYFVNDSLVVRFLRHPHMEKIFSGQEKTLSYIAPRVPFPIGIFEIKQGVWRNQPLIMGLGKKIGGHSIPKHDFERLSLDKKRYLFEQMCYFSSALHALTQEEMKPFHILSATDLEWIGLTPRRWSLKVMPNLKSKEVLCHNDLHSENVHIDSSYRITGVFDFDFLSFGHVAWDIIWSTYSRRDATELRRIYEGVSGETIPCFKLAQNVFSTVSRIYIAQQFLKNRCHV